MVAVIFAGGENKRIPVLKGLIEINGRCIIEHQISLLKTIFKQVYISTNQPEFYFGLGVPLVGDILKGQGPLAGILSALIATGQKEIFAIACDMPFVRADLISHIIANRDLCATVPVHNGVEEPLFAIYSKGIIQPAIDNLRQGKLSLRGFLRDIDVKYIEEHEVRAIDPEGRSFVNINSAEDYKSLIGQEVV